MGSVKTTGATTGRRGRREPTGMVVDLFGGRDRSGFVLLEAMLALAIFVFAVLSLARSVEAGLQAGVIQRSDARASRALLNWMRELQAGSIPYNDNSSGTELRGEFGGMRVRQKVVPLDLKDQDGLEINGMLDVTLTVSWPMGTMLATKELRFYAYPLPQ